MISKHLHCGILLLAYYYLTGAQISLQPVNVEPKATESPNSGICTPLTNVLLRLQLENEVEQLLNSSILPQLYGVQRNFPASSCADIYQGHPSGYYWLNVTNEPQLVYCSLSENRCCSKNDGKWMRIAYLNMSDPSAQCPDGWREVQSSPIRTCRRQMDTNINSVNYTSYGIPYSRVCGRIIAYQFGTPNGFGAFNRGLQTLDVAYVDGISVTYGHPRNHIWTFAATTESRGTCPCITDRTAAPSFVNGAHFCEVGINNDGSTFLDGNPLWDGQGCVASFGRCCQRNNPPWFCKQLNQPTTEDIELRIMGSVDSDNSLEEEDTPVELIEIFVQ